MDYMDSRNTIPTMKVLCTPAMVAQLMANIYALRAADTPHFSGSGDQNTSRAGDAFVAKDTNRFSDGASTLETELFQYGSQACYS